MKVRIKANRLEKGDVQYLSLVERGANRAPFKVMKHDSRGQTMIDLSRMFKSDGQAKIVGYVLKNEDRTDAVDAALKSLGIAIDKPVEFSDGTMVFKQQEFDLKAENNGVVAIKMDADFVLLAKGFDPYSMSAEMGFSDILKSQGFMPGLSMAMDALGTTVRQSLINAEGPEDAVTKVEAALDQFHDFAAKLVASIPSTAFKAQDILLKTKAEDAKLIGEVTDEADKKHLTTLKTAKEKSAFVRATKEDRLKVTKAAADAGNTAAIEAEKVALTKAEGELQGEEKAFYEKLAADKRPAFLKAKPTDRAAQMQCQKDEDAKIKGGDVTATLTNLLQKSMETMLGTVKTMVDGVQKSVTDLGVDLGTKVDAVAAVAKDAKETAEKVKKAAQGVILSGSDDDDLPAEREVRKNESTGMQIDTAFNRTVRKTPAQTGRYVGRHGQRVAL